MAKQLRDFEYARKFVRSLGLKSLKEWGKYCKSGNKPDDIPVAPWETYKKEWKGSGDFLGTGRVANKNKVFRSFDQTIQFVRSLGLKNQKEWKEYCKSGNKPDDIPSNPNGTYKKEWKGMGDFLGNVDKKEFKSFESAREFVRELNLKSIKEWEEYCKSGNKPDDIPVAPRHIYKNKGWVSWGDWLGTGRVANQNKTYRSFPEAREFVRSLGLKSLKEWEEYCKSGNKPDDLPTAARTIYKNKEWVSWGDFLGTGIVAPQNMSYRSFPEAREFVRSLGLKGEKEWNEYCKSGNKPDDIPATPRGVYREWKGSGDFLGTGIVAPQNMSYRSFPEAREFVRSLGLKSKKEWNEYCKSGKKPDDIPATPWDVYKEWKKK